MVDVGDTSVVVCSSQGPDGYPQLEGITTYFIVKSIVHALGGYRPSFKFQGFLAQFLEADKGPNQSHTENLQLILRFEPPSPKFKRQCPGTVSYRMQVADGPDFLFSMRGLPQHLEVHQNNNILTWGKLAMAFCQKDDLDTFLSSLKYVEVKDKHESQQPLDTARQEAAASASSNQNTVESKSNNPLGKAQHSLTGLPGRAAVIAALVAATTLVALVHRSSRKKRPL